MFLQIKDLEYSKYKKDLTISPQFEEIYNKNIRLITQKRKFSQQYGNNKSLINSLQREIERQAKIEYQAVIVRDKEFYYLAFLERENRKNLWKKYFGEVEKSEFQAFRYERLTFKALEKLALIENATFKEFDELEDAELARQLRETYEETYKEKQFLEYKLSFQEKKDLQFDKIIIQDSAKEKQNEIKNDIIKLLIRVIKKLGYQFTPRNNYETLDDFASDVNLQCYKGEWFSIDRQKLLGAEKNGKIQIFKIHNKDFSRAKRTYKNKKNNLFTEYWIDVFERENRNIRILPEIDLFKKRKEKTLEEVGKIVTKRKNVELSKKGNRFCEDKLYAAFRLIFYPEKNYPTVEEFNEKLKDITEKKYFLGLDRGENELLTYCLVNESGKIVVEEKTQKPILGDWNLDDNDFDYAIKLKKFTEKRKEILNKSILLQNSGDDSEKEKIYQLLQELQILESETVKRGICGHILERMNDIMEEYPNTYIIFEDLDIQQNEEEGGNTNKEKNLEKTLGGTAYQIVEDAVISKFKYYQIKNLAFHGHQFVPNIEIKRDLRVVKDKMQLKRNKFGRIRFVKSKDQIGRVLFVDEFLTSQICPECGFCITEEKNKERAEKFGKPIFFENLNSVQIQEENGNGVIEYNGKKYILKHWKYLKEKYKDKAIKDSNKGIQLLKPRLKSQGIKWEDAFGKDPFFCPNCGKNTKDKNFIEPLESGDDIAAYNIAKRGLELLQSKNESQT